MGWESQYCLQLTCLITLSFDNIRQKEIYRSLFQHIVTYVWPALQLFSTNWHFLFNLFFGVLRFLLLRSLSGHWTIYKINSKETICILFHIHQLMIHEASKYLTAELNHLFTIKARLHWKQKRPHVSLFEWEIWVKRKRKNQSVSLFIVPRNQSFPKYYQRP